MNDVLERGAEGESFRDEDWYAEEIGAVRFVDCVFTDVDLTEATTSGTTFEGCTFHTCRLNASAHHATRLRGLRLPRVQLLLGHPRRVQADRLGVRRLHPAAADGDRRGLGGR